ncbi:predicted protein [Sclerotinia sclerotiorum 1980 UF-70]|uniref:Uncharacterized protein n=1 Tax=Sclerotinia sclerotiorum (strain ATCC 18683 / 1980 / Ss-1) TaxID=665079 RepID=A7EH50_SCLS1|nr:predicted protein [Sclerotinia sclerotiorum 1980 UF-70]EDO02166.1 predicted protein [Sclerotinia sclerotiorum 1980 UF-70]
MCGGLYCEVVVPSGIGSGSSNKKECVIQDGKSYKRTEVVRRRERLNGWM